VQVAHWICKLGTNTLGQQLFPHKMTVKFLWVGLKQAPHAWNLKIDCFLLQLGFSNHTTKYGLYVRATVSDLILICLYVDDLLVTESNAV